MADKKTPTKNRLTREDWTHAASRRLIRQGIDAIRVEPLAAAMGVSRGSFYWHFKSRAELLDAILANWRENQTHRIVDRLRQDSKLTPLERLSRLRMLPPRTRSSVEAAALELAIRAWARRDKLARKIVEQVDAERIEFTAALLVDVGMPAAEAEQWARIGYAYTIGESLLRERMTDQQILECRTRLLDMQSAGLPSQAKASSS
jgi:AcrR family transcriptional regulator